MNINDQQAQEQFAMSDAFNGATDMYSGGEAGQRNTGQMTQMVAPQTINEKLMAVRANNPFVSIVQFPTMVNSAFMASIGDTASIHIPSGARYVLLATSETMLVSAAGNPKTIEAATDATNDGDAGIIFTTANSNQTAWYVEGLQSLSFRALATNTRVTAAFYIQQ